MLLRKEGRIELQVLTVDHGRREEWDNEELDDDDVCVCVCTSMFTLRVAS